MANFQYAAGSHGLSDHARMTILKRKGTPEERAGDLCHRTTAAKLIKRFDSGGGVRAAAASGGRQRSLSGFGALCIFLYITAFASASRAEVINFVYRMTPGHIQLSHAALGREYDLLGLTTKKPVRVSNQRDERERVRFWLNGPLFGVHLFGVPDVRGWAGWAGAWLLGSERLVDIDEAGFYALGDRRAGAKALKGQRAYIGVDLKVRLWHGWVC